MGKLIEMRKCTVFLLLWSFYFVYGQDPLQKADIAAPGAAISAQPFVLEQVRLLDGPFKHALEMDQKYLLRLPVDRLLHNFYVAAGLPSAAKPLAGWEAPDCELRGHFTGHYLSACALMYAATGDLRFKTRGDSVVSGLLKCQEKIGTGYLAAFPVEFIDRVETGKRVWAPYYTLHKIFAGLLDMYVHGRNPDALAMAKKFGDWVIDRNARLSDDEMQKMLGVEHGGMNETLANLYALTNEKKYFDISLRFNHQNVLAPAQQNQDVLTGLHANTQIPKFIGTARQYELNGDPALKNGALFFWNTVVKERSYVIGGHSDGELFTDKAVLSQALGPNTTETCNTYNMLKLTRHLFSWEPKAEYMDYYERALFNHILASQHPQTGMMCYYVPLCSGSHKVYSDYDSSFWCCTGTGVENPGRYGEAIYYHDKDDMLYVNLYIASRLDWAEKGLLIEQQTRFPEQTSTTLVFSCKQPQQLSVLLRYPGWATSGCVVKINGRKFGTKQKPGSWIAISRLWQNGDRIDMELPFALHTEAFRDNANRLAFMYGPLVLAGEVDRDKPLPVIVIDQPLGEVLALRAHPNLQFFSRPGLFCITGEKSTKPLLFEPFYGVHGDRHYAVYWDVIGQQQFRDREAEYEKELAQTREWDRRTVDRIRPGFEKEEKDHGLQGEKTEAGDFGAYQYRSAWDGGWFSYRLKVLPDVPLSLHVLYWGSDEGARVFDILIDGEHLARQKLAREKPDRFFSVQYPLPAHLLAGKSTITVKFSSYERQLVGGIYDFRIVKTEP
jgi:uncharacterized protein